jgi:hypothetical protein
MMKKVLGIGYMEFFQGVFTETLKVTKVARSY